MQSYTASLLSKFIFFALLFILFSCHFRRPSADWKPAVFRALLRAPTAKGAKLLPLDEEVQIRVLCVVHNTLHSGQVIGSCHVGNG